MKGKLLAKARGTFFVIGLIISGRIHERAYHTA